MVMPVMMISRVLRRADAGGSGRLRGRCTRLRLVLRGMQCSACEAAVILLARGKTRWDGVLLRRGHTVTRVHGISVVVVLRNGRGLLQTTRI